MKTGWLALLMTAAALVSGAVEIREYKNNIVMNNGTLLCNLVRGRNYIFNMSGRDPQQKNCGLVLNSQMWYHGRTGNTQKFYQDQSEMAWKTRKYEIAENCVRVHTGTVDYDVIREVEMYPDTDAVRLEYIIRAAESRDFTPEAFPAIYFTKQIASVSFDQGHLRNYQTKPFPNSEELFHSRALFLHMPAHGRTLLMLVDLNTPLEYGHKLGIAPKYVNGNWCRIAYMRQLWQGAMPYYEKGMKFGARLYFKWLDGTTLTEAHQKAARELARRFNLKAARFTPEILDGEYRRPSALAGRLTGLPGLEVWHETPMKRVYPYMELPKVRQQAVELRSAANERESAQIVLNPAKKSVLEKVVFTDLIAGNGRRIAAANLKINALAYQTVASDLAVFYEEKNFADKMLPLPEKLPLTLPAAWNTVLHLTVFAPADTAAGLYQGEVKLQISGRTCRIPLKLTVWNFALPKYPSFTAQGLIWNSPQSKRAEVLKYLGECRMNGAVYSGGQRELRQCFDGKEVHFADNLALAEKAIREYGQIAFQVPWAFMGAWNWKPGQNVAFLNLNVNSKEFDEKFANYLKSFHRQVKAKGILENSFIYMWDEMTKGHYKAMQKTSDMVRKYAPGLRIMSVAAPDPEVLANNDTICAGNLSAWWSRDAQKILRDARKNGRQFWIYMNGVTFNTISSALMPRLTPWICNSHEISGYLQWSMDYAWRSTFANHGHVWLLYPEEGGRPVYSVRLEYFRDGVEDYDMIQMVKKLPADVRTKLEKEIEGIAPAFGRNSYDPVRIAQVRRHIGEALDRMK